MVGRVLVVGGETGNETGAEGEITGLVGRLEMVWEGRITVLWGESWNVEGGFGGESRGAVLPSPRPPLIVVYKIKGVTTHNEARVGSPLTPNKEPDGAVSVEGGGGGK